jgi:hypothetical protein
MKNFFTGKRIFYISYIVLLLGIAATAYAVSTGITGVTKKGIDPGCICHNPEPSPNVSVMISGPDTVLTGETVNFNVTITGGPLVRGGTNIAVLNGDINIIDNSLRKESGELTHVSPKLPSGSEVTFEFSYTAPGTQGVDTLYANGNSVNFNGSPDGDQWNFADNKPIVIEKPTAITGNENIADGYFLSQNFPNPFNPETRINFSLSVNEFVSLKIFDATGVEVATLVNGTMTAGNHEVVWNASGFSSGIYFYRLSSGEFSDVKRMMLIK